MEFVEANYPKDDCLKILRFLCFEIFKSKLIKFFLFTSVHCCTIIMLAQTYIFLEKFEASYFVKYAPMYFALQLALTTCVGIFFTTASLKQFENIKIWTFKNTNHKLAIRIREEAKNVTVSAVLNLALAISGGFLFMISWEDNEDIFFVYNLVKNFILPSWMQPISVFFAIACSFFCYVGASGLYQFVYSTFHAKFQIQMITNYAATINGLSDERAGRDLLQCEEYQREVKVRLKLITKRHGELQRFGSLMVTKIWAFILLYTISGALFIISLVFFIFTSEKGFVSTYVRIIPMAVASFTAGATVIEIGQEIENATSRAFDNFCILRWYEFNQENKKIYLIILNNLVTPFRVKFSENIAVNYSLGLSILRTVFSMISVLRRMKSVL